MDMDLPITADSSYINIEIEFEMKNNVKGITLLPSLKPV